MLQPADDLPCALVTVTITSPVEEVLLRRKTVAAVAFCSAQRCPFQTDRYPRSPLWVEKRCILFLYRRLSLRDVRLYFRQRSTGRNCVRRITYAKVILRYTLVRCCHRVDTRFVFISMKGIRAFSCFFFFFFFPPLL
jgi:hypothetical protein